MRDASTGRRGEHVQHDPLPPMGSDPHEYDDGWRHAAAERARDVIDSGAEYLREHDIEEIREEIEGRVRERPLVSLAIAAFAGFLLARMMRR